MSESLCRLVVTVWRRPDGGLATDVRHPATGRDYGRVPARELMTLIETLLPEEAEALTCTTEGSTPQLERRFGRGWIYRVRPQPAHDPQGDKA